MAYVYMLTNERGNVLYIGATKDLKKRLAMHQGGFIPGFTKKYKVSRLVYFEKHADIGAARTRERFLKGKTRVKKNEIIGKLNPTLSDLSSQIS